MPDQIMGFVIFGPDFREMTSRLVVDLTKKNIGGCVVSDERVDALRRSMSRTLPGDRMSPCVLMFAHYVPPNRGPISEGQIREWVTRFRSSIERSLVRSGSPDVNWNADKSSGNVSLTVNWPQVDADTCLELAKAIEDAFDSSRGSSGVKDESFEPASETASPAIAAPPSTDKIRFHCPKCGKSVSVALEHAGKRGKCPGCGTLAQIPTR